MEQTVLAVAAEKGLFAVLLVIVGYLFWRQMNGMQIEAKAREERMAAESKAREDQMHAEAIKREDRLMTLAEDLTSRFETLAAQYDSLSLDVHEIKAVIDRGRE